MFSELFSSVETIPRIFLLGFTLECVVAEPLCHWAVEFVDLEHLVSASQIIQEYIL